MKISKPQRKNIIFLIVIALLIIPQTRQPIQILVHKGLAQFGPSIVKEKNREVLTNFDWELKDLNNGTINFNDMRGEVVMVNLWATWCPPCIAEMPGIQKLHDDYKDKINFVLVSNEEYEVVKKFMKKNDYDLNSYQPVTKIPELLQSRSIPRTILIDKQGNIIIDKSGAADWNSEKVRNQIDELLIK
jgi:thiol-disulfide isomerase/thioredoxin